MGAVLGFDVYGTLIDTHGVTSLLETMIGPDAAPHFSRTWREKQLEYTFRRGLMGRYRDFGVCTRHALEHTIRSLGHNLADDQVQQLIDNYSSLPAFPDAVTGLETLQNKGYPLYAFSNGQAHAVDTVLKNAAIRHHFKGIVSVDEIGTFKPDPSVYRHFCEVTGFKAENAWLVSSNGFDVIGAIAIGMKAAWIKRSDTLMLDPWEFPPTAVLSSISSLIDILPDIRHEQAP